MEKCNEIILREVAYKNFTFHNILHYYNFVKHSLCSLVYTTYFFVWFRIFARSGAGYFSVPMSILFIPRSFHQPGLRSS